MSVRRVLMAGAVVCGVCVWGFARTGDTPVAAHSGSPAADECDDDGDNHDEAAARYRASQSRHWRQVAIGSSTAH